MCLNLFVFLFLVTPCVVVAVQPCMEWIPIEKEKKKKKTSETYVVTKKMNFIYRQVRKVL